MQGIDYHNKAKELRRIVFDFQNSEVRERRTKGMRIANIFIGITEALLKCGATAKEFERISQKINQL